MVLEGWLLKKGEKKKGLTGSTRMRKRFFKQRGKYLYYYKSEEDVINPLGIIDVSEIKEIINVDGKPAFDVVTPERTFHLVVADSKNSQYWIEGLHKSKKEFESESKTEGTSDANSKSADTTATTTTTTTNDQESKLAHSLPKKTLPAQVATTNDDDASRPKSGTLPLSYGSPRFKPEKPKAESLFAKPKNPSPFAKPNSSSSSSEVPSFANPAAKKTKKIKDILDYAPHSPSPFSSPAVEAPESVPPQLVGASFNNPRPNAKPSPPIPNSPQAFTSGGVTKPVPQFNRIGSSSSLTIPMRVSPLAAAQSQPLLPAAVVYSPPAPARGNRDEKKDGIPAGNGSGEDKSYEQMSIEILLKRINQLSEETKEKEEKLGKVSAEHRRAIATVTDRLKSLNSARETEKAVWNGRVSQIEKENEAMKEEMKLVGAEIRKEYQEMLKSQEEGMKELEGLMGDYEKSDNAGKVGLKIRIEMKEKELENTKKFIVGREKMVLGMEERMRDNWH